MKNFKEVVSKAKNVYRKPRIVVACPYDRNILEALDMIQRENVGHVILVGVKDKVENIKEKYNLNILPMEFIEEESDAKALKKSYDMVMKNQSDIIMKGLVQTKEFMKIILSDRSFIKSKLLTHISVFDIPNMDKLLFVSDPSIITEPSFEQKKVILDNALEVMGNLGIAHPRVAIISSTEVPNESIKSSIDAAQLTDLQEENAIWNAQIYGPLAIDNAVSKEAAKIKSIDNEVAGNADLLLMPNLDAGNIFCKGLVYIGKLKSAGIIMGASNPIVLTSRSANAEEKFYSLCLACILTQKYNK